VTALQYGEYDLITGDSTGYLSLFWIESGEIQTSIKVHDGPVCALQADASKAVTSGRDMVIQVVDIIRGVIIQSLRGHCQPISDVAFDSRQIISLSIDGEIRTWDWDKGNQEGRRLQYE
jgi:WD40 repeat protein